MREYYDYRRIRVAPRTWRQVAKRRSAIASAVAAAGGTLFGLWTGQIGLGANEGVLITAWPDLASLDTSGQLATEGIEELVDQTAERLVATVRPESPEPAAANGVYAHRWFDLAEANWPEFLQLSEAAWPDFESTYGARILGFFRSLDVAPPRARVLLLTFYPSLAVWEQSRGEGDTSPTARSLRQRFGRRHELTDSTIVRTTRLLA